MASISRYTCDQFEEIKFQGFDHTTRQEVIDMISLLAEKVGAPSYVKTPIFEKRVDHKKRNKSFVVSDEEWDMVRNFKGASSISNRGDAEVESIRSMLNKVSEPTYENIKASMLAQIGILRQSDDTVSKVDTVVDLVLDVASSNHFYSSLYADLCASLCEGFPEFKERIPDRFNKFVGCFSSIVIGDPSEDYDGFCKANRENDKRRAHGVFFVNLMKRGLLSEFDIILLVDNLQALLLDAIENQDSSKAEEITENLFVITSSCPDQLRDTAAFPNILSKLKTIATSKPKECPGLNNKIVFKHMDILDILE